MILAYLPSILAWLAIPVAWLLLYRTREAIHKAPETVRTMSAKQAARVSTAAGDDTNG